MQKPPRFVHLLAGGIVLALVAGCGDDEEATPTESPTRITGGYVAGANSYANARCHRDGSSDACTSQHHHRNRPR